MRSGDRYVFVNQEGERRDVHVVDHVAGDDLADRVTLLNTRTQKMANITVLWLTQGELPGRMHWLREDAA